MNLVTLKEGNNSVIKLLFAAIRSNVHSMFHFHRIYSETLTVKIAGIRITIKHLLIKCSDCDKIFYRNKNENNC
jgi:hypothetical protein